MKNSDKRPEDKLTNDEIKEIKTRIDIVGAVKAAEILHISRLALANALAGLDCTRGTISLIRQHYETLQD